MTAFAECMAKIRCSHKAGHQMTVVLPQQPDERVCRLGGKALRRKVKIERKDMRRLRLRRHGAVLPEKRLPKTVGDFVPQRGISFILLVSAQNPADFRKQASGISVIRSTGQIVGRRTEVTAFLCVERNPVPELKLVIPDDAVCVRTHKINPFFHALKLIGQNLPVTVGQIQRPRNDDRGVGPRGGGVGSLTEQPVILFFAGNNIRPHMGNAAFRRLIGRNIRQPFTEEQIRIGQKSCRAAKDLSVARPAHPFIALRTIGGNIHKVILHTPHNIMLQLIERRFRARKTAGFPQL